VPRAQELETTFAKHLGVPLLLGPNSEVGHIANPTSFGTSATTVANRLAGTAVLE
jgi:hypothetical protein